MRAIPLLAAVVPVLALLACGDAADDKGTNEGPSESAGDDDPTDGDDDDGGDDDENNEDPDDEDPDDEDPDDEDPDDEDPDDENPDDGETGADDDFARAACAMLEGSGNAIALASSVAEAGMVVIVPNDAEPYLLNLPEDSDGWLTLEVADWMVTMRFFTNVGVDYTIDGGEMDTEVQANGACTDEAITDQSWYFHEWGSYPIQFDADNPSEAWFVVIQQ
jgi:hypothetical protein